MRSNLCASLFLLPSIALAPSAAAQTSSYSQEPSVIASHLVEASFKADGTGYRDEAFTVRVQSEGALRQLGVLHIGFASKSEQVDIKYARVRRPDGTVVETTVADAIDEPLPVTREAPFYSDLKQKELPIRSLRVGDTLEWAARIRVVSPEAPNRFWGSFTFATEGVFLDEQLTLRLPAASKAIVWTNPHDIAPPTTTTEAGELVYHWQHSNLKPTVGPEADVLRKAKETTVLTADQQLDASQGALPSVAWTSFPDWAAVGAWYRELEASRMQPDATVKSRVAELTRDKSTQLEKAQAIYDFVSTQVRYIGVAFGVGRYQPHPSGDVLNNQYGDCKDKHTLLAAMFSAAGIDADAVLIPQGIRFNPAVPSPGSFNHAITRASVDGHEVWLDSTAETAPWRLLTADLRDKQSLVIPASGTASVERTPRDTPFPQSETWVAKGSLDAEGTSESHISLTLNDDAGTYFRALLRQITSAQWDQLLKGMLGGIGYSGAGGSHPSFTRADDLEHPFVIEFDYHREKAGDWPSLRTVAQLAPVELPTVTADKPPIAPLELGTPRTLTAHAEMKLPPGWRVELPEAIHAKSAFATYDETFAFKDGAIVTDRTVVVLVSKVPPEDWKQYKAFQDAGSFSDGDFFIQLIKPSAAAASTLSTKPVPSATVSNRAAADLVEKAYEAVQNHKMDEALQLLNQARALNPEQHGLWATYGYRAYDLGMPHEAVDAYRKEIALHPDQTWVYAPMAEELIRMGQKDEARKVLREAIAARPADLNTQLLLFSLLVRDGSETEAIATGKAALKDLPPADVANASLALALAQLELDHGDTASCVALIKQVLKPDSTPLIQNDAAYMLAVAGVELPYAEETERKALETLSAETRAWTLDEAPAKLTATSSLLSASWDTLGFILLKAGKLDPARSYVRAAWLSRQSLEVGVHLGDIELAGNRPDVALETYTLTLTTSEARSPPTTHSKAYVAAAKAGIKQAKSAGAHAPPSQDSLQKLRSIDLGVVSGLSGTAEYRVLLSGTKVEQMRAADKSLPSAEPNLRSADFTGWLPEGVNAKLVLTGFLNCVSGHCTFVIEN